MVQLQEKLQVLREQDLSIWDFFQQKAMDGVWFWYKDQPHSKWVSPRFLELLGYCDTNVWSPVFHQNIFSTTFLSTWKQFIKVCGDNRGISQKQRFKFIHKEGHAVWMDCIGICFPDKQKLTILLTFNDITDLKAKEKLLLDTNRDAKIGAWEINLDTKELFWSNITRNIHEVPSDFQPSLTEGINFYKEGYSRDTINRCVQEGLEKGTPWNVELKIITYTNREIWVRAIGKVEFRNGKALRIYGSFQDIDTEKQTEEKLRQLSILKAQSEDMEQFAYIVSHDLREPLASMIGYIRLLQESFAEKLPADAQELLAATVETATRMDSLIHHLLDYSKEGQTKNKQLVNTSQLIEKVLFDLSAIISENQAVFEINKLPNLYAYSTELKSVFQNIISNAIKFRKPDVCPQIKIDCKAIEQGWEFRIKDNGIGIPTSEKQKIFNIFQRVHREKYNGTGIGLASCKKIVEHHNGKIWVESELGSGSCFYFTILD